MKILFIIILLFLFFINIINNKKITLQAEKSYCNNVKIKKCQVKADRDLLFVIDGSDSMEKDKFYNEMLAYAKNIYCAFDDVLSVNRAGMIIFNAEIKVVIPLGIYSKNEWEKLIDNLKTDDSLCCSCCTPTAEAFELALDELKLKSKSDNPIVFTITDGQPYQNNYGQWGFQDGKGINIAEYNYKIVPKQARNLKKFGARIFLVGVPNKNNLKTNTKYFNGVIDPLKLPSNKLKKHYGDKNNLQCEKRYKRAFCEIMKPSLFPIVSKPVSKNSFSTDSWDINILIDETIDSLCEILPKETNIPTVSPTFELKNIENPPPITNQPTNNPINSFNFNFGSIPSLDLYILLDRSNSMENYVNLCKRINTNIFTSTDYFIYHENDQKNACWQLFLNFVKELSKKLSEIENMKWFDDYNNEFDKGLRIYLVGFSCTKNQNNPLLLNIYDDYINSYEKLINVLNTIKTWEPSGNFYIIIFIFTIFILLFLYTYTNIKIKLKNLYILIYRWYMSIKSIRTCC